MNRIGFACHLAAAALVMALIDPAVAARRLGSQGASCADPDPRDVRQVYQCMMSMRQSNVVQRDPVSAFERYAFTECTGVALQYQKALRFSGYRNNEVSALTPSCKVLAQALELVRGKPSAWAACTDYPGRFDAAHMRVCLNSFLPLHYGGRKALRGCADAIDEYEKALRAATPRLPGSPNRSGVPLGYDRPSCDAVAQAGIDALAGQTTAPAVPARQSPPSFPQEQAGPYQPAPKQETEQSPPALKQLELGPAPSPPQEVQQAPPVLQKLELAPPQQAPSPAPRPDLPPTRSFPCGNYEPSEDHMRGCLGAQVARYTSCIDLRRAYETALRQAYGGEFPSDYAPLDCEATAPVVEEAQAQNRARVAKAQETQRQITAQRQRQASIYSNMSWDELALAMGREAIATYISPRAFYAHLSLGWAFLLLGWWTIHSGRRIELLRKPLSPLMEGTHTIAQGVLLYFGMVRWGFGWLWFWGALAAAPAFVLLTLVMRHLRFFDPPAVRIHVGETHTPPPGKRPPPRNEHGSNDQDRGDRW